jgi:hypothetical protein
MQRHPDPEYTALFWLMSCVRLRNPHACYACRAEPGHVQFWYLSLQGNTDSLISQALHKRLVMGGESPEHRSSKQRCWKRLQHRQEVLTSVLIYRDPSPPPP